MDSKYRHTLLWTSEDFREPAPHVRTRRGVAQHPRIVVISEARGHELHPARCVRPVLPDLLQPLWAVLGRHCAFTQVPAYCEWTGARKAYQSRQNKQSTEPGNEQ